MPEAPDAPLVEPGVGLGEGCGEGVVVVEPLAPLAPDAPVVPPALGVEALENCQFAFAAMVTLGFALVSPDVVDPIAGQLTVPERFATSVAEQLAFPLESLSRRA